MLQAQAHKFRPVSPGYVSSLKLNAVWLPLNVVTARAAFQLLLQKKAWALDSRNVPLTYEEWFYSEKVVYHEDTPALRSANDIWPVPTLLVLRSKAYLTPNIKRIYSKKDLCEHFDFRCQNCNKRFPVQELTFEHVVPQKIVGNWRDNNVTLTCKKCNARKADIFPYYTENGSLQKPVNLPPGYVPVRSSYWRPEWEPFLFKNIE